MMDAFLRLVASLRRKDVRFVVIGVWGANYYASTGHTVFHTYDRDLFLPPDADNELGAWEVCDSLGLPLWCGPEPLGVPRDRWLAQRIVDRRMNVTAMAENELPIDFSLTMGAFEFDTVWHERTVFRVDDVEVPVARLSHIIESKRAANREKDRLFLATYDEALRHLLGE